MSIRRIVPNISSNLLEESRKSYQDFLGLKLVMDMHWILTFASSSNPMVQIRIIIAEHPPKNNSDITITLEVTDIEAIYKKARADKYEITYPITNEDWGVRRFFVKDPNGVTLNLMSHIK